MEYLLALVICSASALYARTKGFNPLAYFLAGGPVGIGLLTVIPAAKGAPTAEQARARRAVADKLGMALSAVTGVALVISMLV